jgi:hypothetical protein
MAPARGPLIALVIYFPLGSVQATVLLGSFQAAFFLPVNVCCANRAFYGDFFMFRFTFEEGAWTKVPKTDRTFAILLLDNAVVN